MAGGYPRGCRFGRFGFVGFQFPFPGFRGCPRGDTPDGSGIGLNTLWSPYGNNYDLMITGSCFAILPLLLIYLFAQRFIVEGMTAGAVKG